MDQTTTELIVRLTARVSVVVFAAALIFFAAGYRHDRRRLLRIGTRLFGGFIAAHTIHFSAVAWLAVVTSGENIRERDGWAAVVTVGLLFYAAVFLILRAWSDAATARSSSRSVPVTANVAVVAITAAFLNSYFGRAVRMPIYWLPALALAATVALYFVKTRRAALPALRPQRPGDDVDGR